MKLSDLKTALYNLEHLQFKLEDGTLVPPHFHLTEIGIISKKFMDCGGLLRDEKVISLQLWSANDLDHRLKPEKFLSIIDLGEEKLNLTNLDIEVEYQAETIGKYDLSFDGKSFVLNSKTTNCLAQDACGIPKDKLPIAKAQTCTPGGGCC